MNMKMDENSRFLDLKHLPTDGFWAEMSSLNGSRAS